MCEYTLNIEYLPARQAPRAAVVLLHGWAGSRLTWHPLVAHLRDWADLTLVDLPGCTASRAADARFDTVALARAVLEKVPDNAVYLGWSLGGLVAAEIAAQVPDRVATLATLACNPHFLAGEGWPGMDPGEFDRFHQAFGRDPGVALARFDRLMATGAAERPARCRQIAAARGTCDPALLRSGLDRLRDTDARAILAAFRAPQLHLYSAGDALVPPAVPEALRYLLRDNARARVAELPDCAGHVPHLEQPAAVAGALATFLEDQAVLGHAASEPRRLDKADVAASFSRAAPRYDSVACLQRRVGDALLGRIGEVAGTVGTLLDLGCGTGWFREALAQRFPDTVYTGLDIAPGMVDYARAHHGGTRWLVADAENLPLLAGSVDMAYSNLALQWCERPAAAFAEIARALRPGGVCWFTTLGPETLRELRAAWAAADSAAHVNEFLPLEALQRAAATLPGVRLTLGQETLETEYDTVRELLEELKTLGAHNMNRGRGTGLTRRRALQAMLSAYERWRRDGRLPATWQVIYGRLERDDADLFRHRH